MTLPDRWRAVRRILCVRLDNMGDVLMTTPAFRALKASFPGVHLTLLTSSMGAGVAPYVPEIDAVLTFDVPWVGLNGAVPSPDVVMALVERLRRGRFDAAILFTVFSQNPLPAALVCYLAGIPLRLGYCRENPYGLLTDWVPDREPFDGIAHEVTRQLDLVAQVGARTSDDRLSLSVSDAMRAGALSKLRAAGIDPARPWLLLHPGASEARRRYPAAGFVAAGRLLAADGGQIAVTGAASERALAEDVAAGIGPGAASLAGSLDLGAFIGLVAEAPLLVSNNTGPVHIAAATGTPVVVLYARTNPQHTPWRVPCRVLPFDVPAAQRSRNTLLVAAYRMLPAPGPDPRPEDIVTAVRDLLPGARTVGPVKAEARRG